MNPNETQHLAPHLNRVFIIGKDRYKITHEGGMYWVAKWDYLRGSWLHYADIYFAFAQGFNYVAKVFAETHSSTLLFADLQFEPST